MKTIFLCGFMGCGKSTIGKHLAKALGCSFMDLDEAITKKRGRTIPEIFETDGEEGFRRIEAEAVRDAASFGGVVATGGGTILNAQTAELARSFGVVCFLDVPFGVCYERIAGDKNRPLVMQNTKEQLLSLYNTRKPIYQKHSQLIVNADESPAAVTKGILKNLKKGKLL